MDSSNLALDALERVYSSGDFDFSFDLIEACFRVEKKHQFTKERNIPLSELRQVISNYIDKQREQEESDR